MVGNPTVGAHKSSQVPRPANPIRIYYIHTRLAGPMSAWPRLLERAATMGFNHVCVSPVFLPHRSDDVFLVDDHEAADPVLEGGKRADAFVSALASLCSSHGLRLLLDIVLDRVAADGVTARQNTGLFAREYSDAATGVIDPRGRLADVHGAMTRFDSPEAAPQVVKWWASRLARLTQAGAAGFRLLGLERVPALMLRQITDATRREVDCLFLGWTPGLSRERLREFESASLDGVFASTPWWDGRAGWYAEEHDLLCRVGPVIGVAEAPFADRVASRADSAAGAAALGLRTLRIAAATGGGMIVPMGFEYLARRAMEQRHSAPEDMADALREAEGDLSAAIAESNGLIDRLAKVGVSGAMRCLTEPGGVVTALAVMDTADGRTAEKGLVVLVNADMTRSHPIPVSLNPLDPAAGALLGNPRFELGDDATPGLAPGEVRVAVLSRMPAVRAAVPNDRRAASAAAKQSPIVVDRVTPCLDGGAFPAKRIVGRAIVVEADIFADGHDILAAELLWRAADQKEWQRAPLIPLGNDRWQGRMTPTRIGRHLFTVEAWRDEYASLCHGIELKHQAGVDITLDLAEAAALIERVAAHAVPKHGRVFSKTLAVLSRGDAASSVKSLTARAARDAFAAAEAAAEGRAFAVCPEPISLEIDRPQAEHAAWYELFPRSQTDDPARHGTFTDVIGQLPRIRDMGFDVLYFPPIHPIGIKNRKGRNNSLNPGPEDFGSPYAIGGKEGGHDALHPLLGTAEEFRRLVAAARDHGMEIALDFAIQCSLDHPWLRDHPGWFRHRPDGSIKYAENPPKKYEDIVNVDFHADDAVPGLWLALRDSILHWVGEGVRTFRVDNPHTKPLPFWQWMIGDIRARHPDVLFLSEAFTRPKMMLRLAKVGFSQSYTYFTWRNSKQELTDYLTELTTTEAAEYFRPHFFVNTPDINPVFLQTSGRPGFLIRAALAATLSGLWGVYSGFEICEAAPLPGREEYLDSEKYEIRIRNFEAPGNIVAEIAALDRIRKAHPALHSHLGVRFYNAFSDRILLYGKMTPAGREMILVAVNLDPHQTQEAAFEVPLWEWQLPDDGSVEVEELMSGSRFVWTGKQQHVRLDPAALPFAIWRLTPIREGNP